ncbi:MAG: toxic anion resistance protein [Oscillospiraceae bacterium]|nr:toxic anion resistance protein [Oscillospiraceae bacterium]
MDFSMNVTDTESVAKEVLQETKVDSAEVEKLKKQAETNALAVMNCDLTSMEQKQMLVGSIEQFGADSMQKSSAKNNLLKVSVGNLSKSGEEGGQVSKSLMDLNREIKNLDPSLVDFTKTGVFGKVFNPIRSYFEKYQKSEDVIANIISSLDKGKATLKNDNTTLALEEQQLRELTRKIAKEIEMGALMDDCISAKIEEAQEQNADPDIIRFVQEEILYPLRQRLMDMNQLTVVNHQGIIAMEVIQRNNRELMRGVDRAKTVTVSALRTAVMVAGALYNQKIVLKKIQMLNETTGNLISSTSKMLKEQGAEIQKQAMEPGVSVDLLKESFADVLTALDEISSYKQEALPKMKATISQFRELADKGEVEIAKLEKGSVLANQ